MSPERLKLRSRLALAAREARKYPSNAELAARVERFRAEYRVACLTEQIREVVTAGPLTADQWRRIADATVPDSPAGGRAA